MSTLITLLVQFVVARIRRLLADEKDEIDLQMIRASDTTLFLFRIDCFAYPYRT